jgi:hypothetical protein
MIRFTIHRTGGAWLVEVIQTEPLPHRVTEPRSHPRWTDAVSEVTRMASILL